MLKEREIINKDVLKVILLAAVLSGISFYLQHNIDINMADEGFLLYGAVQTAAGKVPIRDFLGYDPGRYYWLAAWSILFGEGLSAMRFYLAVFGFMGVSMGLLAARRVVRSFWGLLPIGIILEFWMFPRYHPFEMTFAMGTLFFALRLIEAPTTRRYLGAGVFLGVAAFFGRNLGFYGLLAFLLTIMYIWFRVQRGTLLRGTACFIGGIFIGYSPIFLMSAFIPGYFQAYLDSILFIFRHRATNLPLPVPWPWLAFTRPELHLVSGTISERTVFLHDFFLGVLFLALPVFYLVAIARHFFMKREDVRRNALLTAGLFTGIFYMHYAFSRADIEHLARAIHPLILTVTALVCLPSPGRRRKAFIALASVFLVVSSYYTILLEKPFYKKNFSQQGLYAEYPIRGEKVWISKGQIISIGTIERFVRERVSPDDWLFLAPYIPTMYYILERESPTWNTYFLFKGTPEEQKRVIDELERRKVRWGVVGDIPLNGMEELRFSRTYDKVWEYLQNKYALVDPLWNIPGYVLIERREGIRKNGD